MVLAPDVDDDVPERFICVDKDYKDCRNFDHQHTRMEAPVEDRVTPPWHTMTKEEVLEEMGLKDRKSVV